MALSPRDCSLVAVTPSRLNHFERLSLPQRNPLASRCFHSFCGEHWRNSHSLSAISFPSRPLSKASSSSRDELPESQSLPLYLSDFSPPDTPPTATIASDQSSDSDTSSSYSESPASPASEEHPPLLSLEQRSEFGAPPPRPSFPRPREALLSRPPAARGSRPLLRQDSPSSCSEASLSPPTCRPRLQLDCSRPVQRVSPSSPPLLPQDSPHQRSSTSTSSSRNTPLLESGRTRPNSPHTLSLPPNLFSILSSPRSSAPGSPSINSSVLHLPFTPFNCDAQCSPDMNRRAANGPPQTVNRRGATRAPPTMNRRAANRAPPSESTTSSESSSSETECEFDLSLVTPRS